MSAENVEVVRRLWTSFGDGGLDTSEGFWSEDVEWRAIQGAPDDVGVIRGKKAMRRYLQDWLDTFEAITTAATELIDTADDRVIAVLHVTGRARLSKVDTELRYAVVYTLRDGTIARGREYASRREALEAVGLAE